MEFFINRKPGEIVKHRIHEGSCPLNHCPGNRVSIGTFPSARTALEYARYLYPGTRTCPFCFKELLPETKKTGHEWAGLSDQSGFIRN